MEEKYSKSNQIDIYKYLLGEMGHDLDNYT